MLTEIRVSGFALMDEVELVLGPGLTVITGETGAGKSMLVEALALLRGGRARADVIRTGDDQAHVEALFDLPAGSPVREALEADGRAVEGGLLVRRAIARSGRGRVHLGGGLATVADLEKSVGRIVDITSQHDQQALCDPERQIAILDDVAGNGDLLGRMAAAYEALRAAEADLAAFDADAQKRAEREDWLKFQIAELEAARLAAGEDETLRRERDLARSAEKLHAVAARGEDALYSGDGAAAGRIAGVARDLAPLAHLDQKLAAALEELRSAQAEVEDAASTLSRFAAGVRFDPGRLEEIEERLHLVGRLARKHGGTVEAALARQSEMARELGELGSFEAGLEARRAAVAAARERAAGLAADLSARRSQAARRLAGQVDGTLAELGMRGARLLADVETREALGPGGRDRARFLFAPNPGEEPRPLARIASGGELSRVMLAVKDALAAQDAALVTVFDEVDAGVGAAVAEVVGRKLRRIARARQVLTVTHLPQIAACADRHLRVAKTQAGGRTVVAVTVLDEAGRAGELARMLDGEDPSPEARAHAADLLRRARGAPASGAHARSAAPSPRPPSPGRVRN